MNISKLIGGIVNEVNKNTRSTKKKYKKSATLKDKAVNYFSQEAKDNRFIARAERFERLNAEREAKKPTARQRSILKNARTPKKRKNVKRYDFRQW